MVGPRRSELQYTRVGESQLDALLSGEGVAGMAIDDLHSLQRLGVGETGILLPQRGNSTHPVRPLALVVPDQGIRRLCGRYAQLRTDLSPLTAWCHLLTPERFGELDDMGREPDLVGTDAAWSGLVVAETMLLAGMPPANIRISACLASTTYSIARTKALWSSLPLESVVERYDAANKLCRRGSGSERSHSRLARVRSSLLPMWRCLSALSDDGPSKAAAKDLEPLVLALIALREARSGTGSVEARSFVRPLLRTVPEAQALEQLSAMAPEARLRLFDALVSIFKVADANTVLRRHALALIAGYLATVAAGGLASLSLVEHDADAWPELTGWAYLVGSVGERVTWTSAFDGLGRMVARELQRPLRLDEPPTCDFAFDEALVLFDPELRDPLVHLRIKQAKVVTVALLPGVNIAIPVVDTGSREDTMWESRPGRAVSGDAESPIELADLLQVLAVRLWPYLRPLVAEVKGEGSTPEGAGGKRVQRGRAKRGGSAVSQLPLRNTKKSD